VETQLLTTLQGSSKVPESRKAQGSAGTLLSLAEDVADVVRHISYAHAPPVLVGHSFGGLVVQRYLVEAEKRGTDFPPIEGVALLASSNPQGVDLARFLVRNPVLTCRVRSPAPRPRAFLSARAVAPASVAGIKASPAPWRVWARLLAAMTCNSIDVSCLAAGRWRSVCIATSRR
jgi:alpha-beta hydrolase superfamily lysophospholipase